MSSSVFTAPTVPRPDEVLRPGVDALVARRPSASRHIDKGRYALPFAGWRAQLAVVIRRLAKEVAASRLPLAAGGELRELCASEFDTELSAEPLSALGNVYLRRPVGGSAGVIPRGTRWRRRANPIGRFVPTSEAQYSSIEDLVVAQGATEASVTIRASRPGPHANIVLGPGPLNRAVNANDVEPVEALFDPLLAPVWSMAGGGADRMSDELLRRTARAYAAGRYGPTVGALVAAALRGGAVHVSAFDMPTRALTAVLLADVSWGSSVAWTARIEQLIRDEFEGFGCRVATRWVANVFVRVDCMLSLRQPSFLVDTSEITAAVGRALRSYFDDRPDWWTWRHSALRGVAARAHRKILTCSSLTVRDAVTDAVLAEPTFNPKLGHFDSGNRPYHYYLSDNAVLAAYEVPT